MNFFENENISEFTSLKIGGKVKKFYVLDTVDELVSILKSISVSEKHKIRVLGSGTNVLVSNKENLDYIVIKLDGEFKNISISDNGINAGAAALLSEFLKEMYERGYEGIEILAGIPGTVGGAIAGNAGSKYGYISDFIKSITVAGYDGKIEKLSKKDINFAYRKVVFPYDCMILKVEFDMDTFEFFDDALQKGKLHEKYKLILMEKLKDQPYGLRSAGCVFKNPANKSTGKLIDELGLKGKRIGDVYVSDKHANFFIAENDAKFDDFMALVKLVRDKVKAEKNLELELEIKIWD